MRKNTNTFKTKTGILFVFILLASIKANSQTVFFDSISKKKYAIVDVHKTYERVVEKGYDSIQMLEYLGDYYYKGKDFQKSKLYFDILFKKYRLSDISSKSIEQYKTL